MPSLLPYPSLLAYTIYQSLSFDASLAEADFSVIGTSASAASLEDSSSGKISEVILGRKEWFDAWVDGEKQCQLFPLLIKSLLITFLSVAEDQYQEIISASDAWQIADDDHEHYVDSATNRDLKTTNSARRIKALVEQVTGKHRYFISHWLL